MKEITEKLSNYLNNRGLTQKDIANTLGISEQSVNALVNGRRQFGRKTSAEWQKHFGLSASWLMTGEGEMLAPSMQAGDGSVQVAGNASNVNAGKTIDKLVELLKKSQEQISKRDQQIDKLLAMIDRLTSASPVTD